jgi:hypothetical protein
MPSDKTATTATTKTPPADLAVTLRALGLWRLAEDLSDFVARATKSRWSPTQMIEEIARIETLERARKSAERRLSRARIRELPGCGCRGGRRSGRRRRDRRCSTARENDSNRQREDESHASVLPVVRPGFAAVMRAGSATARPRDGSVGARSGTAAVAAPGDARWGRGHGRRGRSCRVLGARRGGPLAGQQNVAAVVE